MRFPLSIQGMIIVPHEKLGFHGDLSLETGVGKCPILGISFTSLSSICWRWNIPNSWVMWNHGTFTNPCENGIFPLSAHPINGTSPLLDSDKDGESSKHRPSYRPSIPLCETVIGIIIEPVSQSAVIWHQSLLDRTTTLCKTCRKTLLARPKPVLSSLAAFLQDENTH